MKLKSIPSSSLGLLAALTLSTAALAAGTHAGGHDHGPASHLDSHAHALEETAYGQPGQAAQASRTVEIEMSDNMRFTPSEIRVRRGETIRFVMRNAGQLRHEFSLGTRAELEAHYEQMKKFPDMVHDEPNKVSVEPGQTGEVIWQFTRTGRVDFACLHVGHYEAGMKGRVTVK
jgi:uncharacterized cupredoxin-like copper-binding protein